MPPTACPFDVNDVRHAFDPAEMSYVEIESGTSLYSFTIAHIAKYGTNVSSGESRRIQQLPRNACESDDDSDSEEGELPGAASAAKCQRPTNLTAGLGLFTFDFGQTKVFALHESVGEPVASQCDGIARFTHLVLFAQTAMNGLEVIQSLCDKLIDDSERTRKNTVAIFRFVVRNGFWKRESFTPARTMDSVVLPTADKDKLMSDVEDFLSPKTQRWYRRHGIPYRRSYLFHGVPGAGKTSLLQSLAGRYERNLCFLQPSHPDITDDTLKAAVTKVPAKSLIVLEDVDALFSKDREAASAKSPLTFSGLLNALDGVGSSTGQIFVLTTNFRERLDAALIRPGRVDLQVEFRNANREQMQKLFASFYPASAEDVQSRFADAVIAALDGREVSMAALQHYFIVSRRRSAEEAVENAKDIAAEIEAREQEKPKVKDTAAAAKEEEAKEEGDAAAAPKKKSASANGSSAGAGSIHIHVHTAAGADED